MSILKMLMDLEDNYSKVKECNKVLKDGSYMYLLKKLKREFESTKSLFELKSQELEDLKHNYEELSLNIKSEKKKLVNHEYILYNQAGSDLKLIENLQKEMDIAKKNIKNYEDISFKLLEKEESIREEKENLRLSLISLKENFYNYKEVGNKKINKAKEELIKANMAIDNLRKLIPENLLEEFENIQQRKGTGIAKIKGGTCTACNMGVSFMTLDAIRKGKEIVCCDNCGRILYYNNLKELKEVK